MRIRFPAALPISVGFSYWLVCLLWVIGNANPATVVAASANAVSESPVAICSAEFPFRRAIFPTPRSGSPVAICSVGFLFRRAIYPTPGSGSPVPILLCRVSFSPCHVSDSRIRVSSVRLLYWAPRPIVYPVAEIGWPVSRFLPSARAVVALPLPGSCGGMFVVRMKVKCGLGHNWKQTTTMFSGNENSKEVVYSFLERRLPVSLFRTMS